MISKQAMKGKFDFWMIDFRSQDVKTGEPIITKCDENFIDALRITESKNLVVRYSDNFGGRSNRLYYVPFEYWNASDSPIWFPTNRKKYGYIIREKIQVPTISEQLSLISLIQSKSN